ncbi:mCG1027724, partial [Mus musculus]
MGVWYDLVVLFWFVIQLSTQPDKDVFLLVSQLKRIGFF